MEQALTRGWRQTRSTGRVSIVASDALLRFSEYQEEFICVYVDVGQLCCLTMLYVVSPKRCRRKNNEMFDICFNLSYF